MMRVSVEIQERDIIDKIGKEVHEYLSGQGLLRFIREECYNMNKQAGRKEIKQMINRLNMKVVHLEKRIDSLELKK